jgi:hypothetical protein
VRGTQARKGLPDGRSERIQTFILIGIGFVLILLTIGLGINWLTGHEARRSVILMILGVPDHCHYVHGASAPIRRGVIEDAATREEAMAAFAKSRRDRP